MYCTVADIQAIVPEHELIELTDDASPAEIVIEEIVNRAIADAGELIDGYLRGRYTLPLSPVPGLLGTLAADVAIYRLYARRLRLAPPEAVTERYKNTIKILDQIQAGKISLGAEAAGGGVTPSVGGPQFTAEERLFTRQTLRDY
jgi:phage gp36-like protein